MNEENKIKLVNKLLIATLTLMGYYDSDGNITWEGFRAAIINEAARRQREGQSEISALNDLADELFRKVDYRCESNIANYRNDIYTFVQGNRISQENTLKMANSILRIISTHNIEFKEMLIDGIKSDFLDKVLPQIEEEREGLRSLKAKYSELCSVAWECNCRFGDCDCTAEMFEYIELFLYANLSSSPMSIAYVFFELGGITAKREERARRKKAVLKSEKAQV
jgi:hypothetical protein